MKDLADSGLVTGLANSPDKDLKNVSENGGDQAGQDFDTLFCQSLRGTYFAEKQILRALAEMAEAARGRKLQATFERHRSQTEAQIERLDKVFELISRPARSKGCPAVLGMIAGCQEMLQTFGDSAVLDDALIAAAHTIEHFEISRYAILSLWAQQLGLPQAAKLLATTLEEETQTQELLASLAGEKQTRAA